MTGPKPVPARPIDGKATAAAMRARLGATVAELTAAHGLVPGLAVVLVGNDPASEVYVRMKAKLSVAAGMQSFQHRLDADTDAATLLGLIDALNADPAVHGILVQLPLPDHLDASAVINAIDPAKDVDGFHITNAGRLATGQEAVVPCTPLGCLILLKQTMGELAGRDAVVVGRSNIVGKPMAQLLLQESCTVTIAHSRTRDLGAALRRADIVVAAAGRPRMIGPDWIKPGATVIDVGINRVPAEDGATRLVGDVDFDAVAPIAGAITPVPGGVGPMTIACLLSNTLAAACRQHGLPVPPLPV